MKHEIIKTIFHFTDDKGWNHQVEHEGNHPYMHTWRIPKRARMCDAPDLLNTSEPPKMPAMTVYEFELQRETFEHFALNYYIKHIYYEMR